MTELVPGLAAVADRFDGFAIDQFGVLHDGSRAYPAAAATLAALKQAGKTTVILSNSGKRSAENVARLTELGFPPSLYDAFLSSGEVTWHLLRERRDPGIAALGRRCLLLTRGGDRSIVDGLDLELVDTPEAADFVLAGGTDAPHRSFEEYRRQLDVALTRGLAMLCANPDIVMPSPVGLAFSPGTLAEYYERQGGRVRWIGKPHPDIYAAARERFGPTPPERILAIGDSLAHDVAGGAAAGFRTLYIAGGINGATFRDARAPRDWLGRAATLAAHEGTPAPDWICPRFQW